MAVCGRCATDTPVPAHITVGRVRCRSCGESVDVAAPGPPPTLHSASEGDVIVRARMPGAGSPAAAASSPAAPRAASVGLQSTCPACGERYPAARGTRCPACGKDGRALRQGIESERAQGDGFAPERAGLNAGVLGGIAMLAIAVIWFFVGYEAGVIFFYPPLLALLGVFGIVKGMADGNLAGERREPPRRRRGSRRR